MTAARRIHNPVSFPAGSFDREKLQKGLDEAAGASADDRAQAVTDAVKGAAAGGTMDFVDGSLRPDQKLVQREHEELGITENVRVFDPDSDAAARLAEDADREADRLTRQSAAVAARSSEPDVEPVEGAAAAEVEAKDDKPAPAGGGRSGRDS